MAESNQIQIVEEQIILEDIEPNQQNADKNKQFSECLVKGAYVDAKDLANNWCVAQIIERNDSENTVKINYDGWSHQLDEWVSLNSIRLCPFRKYTKGYTGEEIFGIRDWSYNKETFEEKSKRIDGYLSKGILDSFKSAHELTQALRGSDYMFLDALLQHEYQNPQEEFPTSVNYFVKYLKLYIQLLKMIPELLHEFNEGISNTEAFMLNKRIAAILSLHEVSDSVNKIFGCSERCWKYFSMYDRVDIPIKISKTSEYAGKEYEVSYFAREHVEHQVPPEVASKCSHLIVELVNAFGELGGFDEWIRVFTYYEHDPKTNAIFLIPFELMKILLTTISTIHKYLNRNFVIDLISRIKEALTRRFKVISNHELKDLDQENTVGLLQEAQPLLLKFYSPEEVYEFTETTQLALAFKYLTLQSPEEKLKGIKWINKISKKIETHENYVRAGKLEDEAASSDSTKYLNARIFMKWLLQEKFFEKILGDSIHIEILKSCGELFLFLAKYETIPLEIIDLLWSSCKGKQENIVRVVYHILIAVSPFLRKDSIQRLQKQILSIPQENLNEMHLFLIKKVVINVLTNRATILDQPHDLDSAYVINEKIAFKELCNPNDEDELFCVSLLWELLLDDSRAGIYIAQQALATLGEILKHRECKKLRQLYLYECFEKLRMGESTPQCINLAHQLLVSTYYNIQSDHEDSLWTVLQELDQKFSVIELIVSNMENYHSKAKKILEGEKDYSKTNDALRNKIVIGKYTHHINFHNRFVFLEFMLASSYFSIGLSETHIERLWEIYVIDRLFDYDQAYFLEWISPRRAEIGSEQLIPVGIKKVSFFFNEILCGKSKLDCENLNPEGFKCFEAFFKTFNQIEYKFKVDKIDEEFEVIDINYFGKKNLWEIFLLCKNRMTLALIVDLIAKCYLKLDHKFYDKKAQVREEFVINCIELFKEAYAEKNEQLAQRASLLMMRFFDYFEAKNSQDKQNLVEPGARAQSKSIFKASGFHPGHLLSANLKYIDLLFSLLATTNSESTISIWDLLMRLPTYTDIKIKISRMEDSWDNIIGTKNNYRLLYCLQIIEDFVYDHEKEKQKESTPDFTQKTAIESKNLEWVQKFIQKGGIRYLFSLLT